MAKRKVIRKSNRPFTYDSHYYSWGGDLWKSLNLKDSLNIKDTFSGSNVGSMLKGGISRTAGNLVGNVGGNLISGGLESGVGNAIGNVGGAIGGVVSTINPVLGGIISAGTGIIGGLANRMFGSRLNKENIANIESSNTALNTLNVDNSSFDSISNQWANQDFGDEFSRSDVGKDGWFSNKAKKKYRALKSQQEAARNRALLSYENAADAADIQQDLNAMASFAAYGGPLGIWGGYGNGAIDYELAKENLSIKALNAANKGRLTSLPNSFESPELNTFAKGGKIHIKPSKRGTFTSAAKRHGKSVQSFASQVLANKENYSPAMVKKANFARNAAKWHSFGGELNTNGADFSNGQTIIGNGGTHEENPMEGVPMGVDSEGTPNLVEQGEVIFNDYVFSNRLTADKELLKDFGLPTSYDNHSFASIAEKLGEESKERPNDPISKRGLLSSMSRLQQAQETVRQQAQESQEGTQYAHGGRMGTLFDGLGNMPNSLDGADYGDWQDYGTLLEPISAEDVWNGAMSGDKGDNNSKLTWLRYAPIVGAAIGLGQNLFSRPDYTSADTILEAANQAGNYTPIGYTPIGNYLQYRPFDRNFYLNKLNAQAGATRRAIMNTTSPSRNAALLAADYNAQGRLGDLTRQAEEYNLAQRQAVETFNRGTNQANAEMGLKAAMANQEAALKARSSRLSGVAQAMAVRDAVDARRGASMSANLTNLFNSLGDIGIDAYNREDRDKLIRAGVFGTLSEKPQEWSDKTWKEYKDYINKSLENKTSKVKGKQYSKGGYLTIKKGKQHGKF